MRTEERLERSEEHRKLTFGAEGWTSCTILSAGPSVLRVRESQVSRPLIAVNRAICRASDLPVDYWAAWDKPQTAGLQDEYPQIQKNSVRVWCRPEYLNEWVGMGWKGVEPLAGGWIEYPQQDGTLIRRAASTIALVVEEAARRGARLIHVYGADMRGSSARDKYLGRWSPIESPMEAERWIFEVEAWDGLVKAGRKVGVDVRRCAA